MASEKSEPTEGKAREWHVPGGQTVVVQCAGFRCLAYLDKDGKWRDAVRNNELPEVLEVLSDMGNPAPS